MKGNFKHEIFPYHDKSAELGYIKKLIYRVNSIEEDIHNGQLCIPFTNLFNLKNGKVRPDRTLLEDTYGPFNSKSTTSRKNNNEYEGLYIFLEERTPVYTGISRGVVLRLRNHGWGNRTNLATLAYLMANTEQDIKSKQFNANSKNIQDYYVQKVRGFNVYIYPYVGENIDGKDEYYSIQLLEVMVALRLKTRWNTFKTH